MVENEHVDETVIENKRQYYSAFDYANDVRKAINQLLQELESDKLNRNKIRKIVLELNDKTIEYLIGYGRLIRSRRKFRKR